MRHAGKQEMLNFTIDLQQAQSKIEKRRRRYSLTWRKNLRDSFSYV